MCSLGINERSLLLTYLSIWWICCLVVGNSIRRTKKKNWFLPKSFQDFVDLIFWHDSINQSEYQVSQQIRNNSLDISNSVTKSCEFKLYFQFKKLHFPLFTQLSPSSHPHQISFFTRAFSQHSNLNFPTVSFSRSIFSL